MTCRWAQSLVDDGVVRVDNGVLRLAEPFRIEFDTPALLANPAEAQRQPWRLPHEHHDLDPTESRGVSLSPPRPREMAEKSTPGAAHT